ncbi:MAG: hypothetical protein LIQ31_03735 [Planctomycetes bacterium]|nr:hypothetical protein [Planctomycetota bacterium]
MLYWISVAIVVYAASGVAAWIFRHRPGAAGVLGALGCVVAGGFGLYASALTLLTRSIENSRSLLNAPHARLALGIDSLSALFLLPIFFVGALIALAALRRRPGDYALNRPHEHWLFFNCTLAGAALAVVSRNAILFLFAWEVMTVASFLLIENDQREPGDHGGGWVYLTAGHIGAAALFAMFALLGGDGGVLDFSVLQSGARTAGPGIISVAFVLAFTGFGGKVGLAPFQTWYPEGYPPAPAHVGALLSGVVGNMGIYGLLRFLMLAGGVRTPPVWWGYLLLFAGLASALIGAVRAMAARDLTRLLAWSSVENYGLMGAGIGLGLLGAASGNGVVSYLGFAGVIFHMLNHSVSKSLLFLSAGAVYSRTGTRRLDTMGGLSKRLPLTGLLFLVGSLGAASVLPLNGFVSEFLILMAAFNGATMYEPASVAAASMFVAVIVMALVGGLAVAAYVKAFGFVFLGNLRGPGAASRAKEQPGQLLPHAHLAVTAVVLAVTSPDVLDVVGVTTRQLVRLWRFVPEGADDLDAWLASRGAPAGDSVFLGAWLLIACLAFAYILRAVLMRRAARESGPTWDCGYIAPDGRMQYTATSFTRPIVEDFDAFVKIEDRRSDPQGLFPTGASFSSWRPGIARAFGFSHLFRLVGYLAARLRILQEGRVQLYLLYMAAVLVILLMWKL